MPFVQITEGTKNYIKEFLLSEQGGNTAPTPRVNPNKFKGTAPRQRGSMSTSGKGSGMGLKYAKGYTIKPPPTDLIDYATMFGNTTIPGTTDTNTKMPSSQLGLNYMSTLSKGSAAIEVLDQMLAQSPTLKTAVASNLMSLLPHANPNASKSQTSNVNSVLQQQIGNVGGPAGSLLSVVSQLALPTSSGAGAPLANNKLYNKVMQYSFNTTGFDPTDPLGGLRRGLELMGGQHIRKNVARQGQAQQRGAETTMGHPSGSGNW